MLQLRNISKSFGAVRVLTNVHLELRKGEIHALMGENGAGKSTLMKIVSGLIPSYEGEVFVEGERVHLASPRDASRHGPVFRFASCSVSNEAESGGLLMLSKEDGFLRVFGGEEILRMRERQPGDGAVSLFLIGDPPDGIVSILANEESAVFRHGKSHGTTPNVSLRSNESGQEILVSTSRFAMIERDAHHLVTRSFGSVP